jgi:3D (Asp-Asp-Asp) domain-containing protein
MQRWLYWLGALIFCTSVPLGGRAQGAENGDGGTTTLKTTAATLRITITAPTPSTFDPSAKWVIDGETVAITVTARDESGNPPPTVGLFIKDDDAANESGWVFKANMTQAPAGSTTYTYAWNTNGTATGRHRIRIKSVGYTGKAEMIIHRAVTKDTVLTGYCNCKTCCGKSPGDPNYGKTADGCTTAAGTLAAPSAYAFHTEIYVPTYNSNKVSKVHDRGGAITNNRLDCWFPTHAAALVWGRKDTTEADPGESDYFPYQVVYGGVN